MTLSMWTEVLWRFTERGNPSEQRMAWMLLDMMALDDPRIEQVFERTASEILEATS